MNTPASHDPPIIRSGDAETLQVEKFESFIHRRWPDYARAKAKARIWLDQLVVDPVELLRNGVKGKKKLAEILDSYMAILEHTKEAGDRESVRKRVEELARQASRPEYHDMATLSDLHFTQNSMSYLRVAWLLKRFGIETEAYRNEIRNIQPRLDSHLHERGPWQQAMFLEYYDRIGITKPPGLAKAPLRAGVIARRLPAERYLDNETYDLTHEIFVAFDYGAQRRQTKFSAADVVHTRAVLQILIPRYVSARNADLVGELTSCMTYLGWHEDPAYRQAIEFLLDCQNSNGSWGSYEAYRKQFGKYLEHHLYLHTTMVVLNALMDAYEGNWERAATPPQ